MSHKRRAAHSGNLRAPRPSQRLPPVLLASPLDRSRRTSSIGTRRAISVLLVEGHNTAHHSRELWNPAAGVTGGVAILPVHGNQSKPAFFFCFGIPHRELTDAAPVCVAANDRR